MEKRLIKFYKLTPGAPEILPVEELTKLPNLFNNCYKITVGFGQKQGKKYAFDEKLQTYYIGKIVSEREVQQSKIFSRVKTRYNPTVFIKLTNGQFAEIYDTSLVIDLDHLWDYKLIDLFNQNSLIGIV